MNKSLSDLWREYRDKVYPATMPGDQNRECHQAFMAGAFVILQEVVTASRCEHTDSAERTAARRIADLLRESTEWHCLRLSALNDRTRN